MRNPSVATQPGWISNADVVRKYQVSPQNLRQTVKRGRLKPVHTEGDDQGHTFRWFTEADVAALFPQRLIMLPQGKPGRPPFRVSEGAVDAIQAVRRALELAGDRERLMAYEPIVRLIEQCDGWDGMVRILNALESYTGQGQTETNP